MNSNIKLGLYVVSVLGLLIFGSLFTRAWRAAEPRPSATVPPRGQAPVATNTLGTNATAPAAAAAASTNQPAPDETAASAPTESVPESEPSPTAQAGNVSGHRMADLMTWGLLAVVSLGGLGLLLAHDVSQYVAAKATRVLFEEDAQGIDSTDYEDVENAHAKGDFLEAIRLLRDYQKENPKAVHAQIRVAEIYEKDLNNPLAAALEYEEVLKHPLDPDRRGWTAVHLVNLYNRLEKTNEAVQWLHRIVAEVPQTPAANKARERLTALGFVVDDPAENQAPSDEPEEPPAEGLPRGFRRK